MTMLVAAALYVMGGLMFVMSAVVFTGLLPGVPGASAVQPLIGGGIMLALAAIADSLAKINAKMK